MKKVKEAAGRIRDDDGGGGGGGEITTRTIMSKLISCVDKEEEETPITISRVDLQTFFQNI